MPRELDGMQLHARKAPTSWFTAATDASLLQTSDCTNPLPLQLQRFVVWLEGWHPLELAALSVRQLDELALVVRQVDNL
jgi:hypothetical protein